MVVEIIDFPPSILSFPSPITWYHHGYFHFQLSLSNLTFFSNIMIAFSPSFFLTFVSLLSDAPIFPRNILHSNIVTSFFFPQMKHSTNIPAWSTSWPAFWISVSAMVGIYRQRHPELTVFYRVIHLERKRGNLAVLFPFRRKRGQPAVPFFLSEQIWYLLRGKGCGDYRSSCY